MAGVWRRFNFWERHAVEPPRAVLTLNWLCSTCGTGGAVGSAVVYFGGSEGGIAALDGVRLKPVAGWRAHESRVTHLVHCSKVRLC